MDILVKRAQRGDAEAFIELFDPAYGMSAPYLIEGKFLDSHTFAGIIRVDLMDMQVMDDKGEWKQIENFPEEFLYELHVTGIYAKPGKGEHMEGNWDFVLDVKLNHENTVIKEVNETNQNGVGIGTVTPMENLWSPREALRKSTLYIREMSARCISMWLITIRIWMSVRETMLTGFRRKHYSRQKYNSEIRIFCSKFPLKKIRK